MVRDFEFSSRPSWYRTSWGFILQVAQVKQSAFQAGVGVSGIGLRRLWTMVPGSNVHLTRLLCIQLPPRICVRSWSWVSPCEDGTCTPRGIFLSLVLSWVPWSKVGKLRYGFTSPNHTWNRSLGRWHSSGGTILSSSACLWLFWGLNLEAAANGNCSVGR